MEGVLVYGAGEGKASEGMKLSGEGQAYGVTFMYRWRSTKRLAKLEAQDCCRGQMAWMMKATRISLTHLIVQGIYYLQILGSKLALLREGIYQGLQVRLQFWPESCAALYYDF